MIRSSLRSSSSTQGVPSTCANRAVTSYSSCPRYSIRLWVVFSSSACRAASPNASPACTCSAVSMRTEGTPCAAAPFLFGLLPGHCPPCAVFSSLSCTPVSPSFLWSVLGSLYYFCMDASNLLSFVPASENFGKMDVPPGFCLSGPDRRAAVRRKVTQNRSAASSNKAPARFRKFRHADGRTVLSKTDQNSILLSM